MSKFSHKQSQLQPKSNHLVLSLLGSMLIHGVIVLILSRNQTPQPEIIEEPIQVIILEPTVSRSPEATAISEPRSKSKPLVSSTPKNSPPSNSVTATPKSPLSSTETRSIPTPAPIKTAPVKPAPQKQPSPAKIESDSTTQKLDNSSISTSTETSVKSPQIPSHTKSD